MDNAFNYTLAFGIATEEAYPYTGKDGKCSYESSQSSFKNAGFADVPANQASQMLSALSRQPVAVAIQADTMGFQFYKKGVFTGKGLFGECGTNLDHGVLAAGFGVDDG